MLAYMLILVVLSATTPTLTVVLISFSDIITMPPRRSLLVILAICVALVILGAYPLYYFLRYKHHSHLHCNLEEFKCKRQTFISLVDHVCPQALDPILCSDILTSDPLTAPIHLKGLEGFLVNLALANMTSTKNYIQLLLQNATELKMPLSSCLDEYEKAIEGLNTMKTYLRMNALINMKHAMKDVALWVDICDNEFPVSGASPLMAVNYVSRIIVDIIEIVLTLLH